MIKVGQRLYETRMEKGLSLEEVAKATKIRQSFLSAIEKGEYNKLPSSAYIQGFVKNYASYLGLPQKETVALLRREFNEKEFVKVLPEGLSAGNEIKLNTFRINQRIIGSILLFVLLILYFGYQYRYAFLNPPLSVHEPKEGKTYSSDLTVSGSTDPNATVVINNTPTSLDKNGNFKKQITVFTGNETVTIVSQNRFGKTTRIERHITVVEKN